MLPNAHFSIIGQYVHIDVIKTDSSSLKQWLWDLQKKLPKIEYPIETVRFIIDGNYITMINPSEFDVRALDYAVESKLKYTQHSAPYSREPLPLDHPWYTDKDYFRK